MQNYDFLILSPPEFENLTRDLLQKNLMLLSKVLLKVQMEG